MLTIPLHPPTAGLPHLAPARDALRRRLRLMVGVLVWGALPAAAAVAAALAWHSWASARANFESRLADTARTAALAVDAKLSAYEAAAQMLAYAPEMQPGGDPARLYAQARAAGRAIGGWVVVIDMTSPAQPQLLNTRAPPARHSQPQTIAARARMLELGQTVVSDLFTPPDGGAPSVTLAVPVPEPLDGPRAGHPARTVDFVVEASTLARLLARQQPDNGGYLLLTDGAHDVIARSLGPSADLGRHIARLDQIPPGGDEGLGSGVTVGGRPALFAWRRLAMAPGWTVAAVAPLDTVSAVVDGPLRGVALAGGGVLAVLLLALLTLWLSRSHDRAAYDDLDRVLANVPAAIFVDRLRPEGTRERLFLSRGVTRIAGWSWQELRADPNSVIELIDPADRPAYDAYRRSVLRSGQGSVELRLRARDGSWRSLRSEESCFERAPDGSMLVAGCVIDVTDAAAAKAQLRQLEKLALLGEVATGIAHEINQPLSAIAMAAENGTRCLTAEPPRLTRASEKFALIQAQAHRITSVISHIRGFGRAGTAEAGPVDVARVIADTMSLLAGRLRQDQVTPHIELHDPLPPVHGVAVMLEQVVMNLLVNAADAYRARPDITHRPLTLIAEPVSPDQLRISVIDQAGGIPDALLERIFDPFFTTKSPGEGTGLGLSISLSTIAAMGGRLTAQNLPGQNHPDGARFDILLPLPTQTTQPTEGCLASPGPV